METNKSALIGTFLIDKPMLNSFVLTFNTDKGYLQWILEPDCCSVGKWTDFEGEWDRIGRIQEVCEIESMVDPIFKNLPEMEPIQQVEHRYGYKIIAERGHFYVIHRNWSNGYYGTRVSEYFGNAHEYY